MDMILFEKMVMANRKATELELQALIARREAQKLQDEFRNSVIEEDKEQEEK